MEPREIKQVLFESVYDYLTYHHTDSKLLTVSRDTLDKVYRGINEITNEQVHMPEINYIPSL